MSKRKSSLQSQKCRRDERRVARNVRPTQFFHVSPYRLRVGTHLKPRWSGFAFQHRVWMVGSIRASRLVAQGMVSEAASGAATCCGRGFDTGPLPASAFRGFWVYRVLPTGPVECGHHQFTTAFPVRVVEVAATVGRPEENRLPRPPVRSDEDIGRWLAHCPDLDRLLEEWRTAASPEAARNVLYHQLWDATAAVRADELLRRAPADGRLFLEGWFRREVERETAYYRKQRLAAHHKLTPDPRYKRDRSWKRREVD
ncbi:MAG: hypothetical protein GYA57_06785 [Myxococcales bacterium]|nr:hypothetical protein [Myxococcales bacterium]